MPLGKGIDADIDITGSPHTLARPSLRAACLSPDHASAFEVAIQQQGPMALRRRMDFLLDQLWRLRINQAVRSGQATA
jgi:hypothetical protein